MILPEDRATVRIDRIKAVVLSRDIHHIVNALFAPRVMFTFALNSGSA